MQQNPVAGKRSRNSQITINGVMGQIPNTTQILSDTAYAERHDLPATTNSTQWHGRTRAISYSPVFRETFSTLSRKHQRQTRIYLKRFFERGDLYVSTKIEKIRPSRGWIPKIPKAVKVYRCGRISAFLRFAYNLIGDEKLILYNIGKKSDQV